MDKNIPTSAVNYLETASQDLKFIIDKIKALKLIQEKVNLHLDASLIKYSQVANMANNTLVILAANSAIATRIRFESVDLLKKLKTDPLLAHLKQIECKVRPGSNKELADKPERTVPPLTPATAAQVNDIAQDINDPTLREIMLKIAKYI